MASAPRGTERARATIEYLRDRIVSGAWPVNSRIPTEQELIAELGVGRSTVREAVRSLANLGMLEPAAGRGTFVRSRTPISGVLSELLGGYALPELLVARRALEVEAARRAATHRTPEQLAALRHAHDADLYAGPDDAVERGRAPGQFHAIVAHSAGSALLTDLYSAVIAVIREGVTGGEVSWGACATRRHLEHARILEAIEREDPDAAATVMAEHVERDLVAEGPPAGGPAAEVAGGHEPGQETSRLVAVAT